MGVKVLQGWHSDPFELHGERYFSAGQPTKLVRDGYLESYDEPPGESGAGTGGSGISWLRKIFRNGRQ